MSIDILEPQVRAPLAISAYDPAESLIQPIGWNPLNHKKGGGTPMGGKKRGGRLSIRGGRGRRSSPLHYMDSGLDGLNTMFPTLESLPYDPFMDKIRAQQKKNANPSAWSFGPTDPALATGYVNGVQTLLSAMSPEDKQEMYADSYQYGGGFNESDYATGPLASPYESNLSQGYTSMGLGSDYAMTYNPSTGYGGF